jgi:SHS family lactate transporter-like MFS transporter
MGADAAKAGESQGMIIVDDLKALDKTQRAAFFASFLGWALDAFDYFLLTFILKDIADEFHTSIKEVSFAITLTLVARPFGAFVFGRLADRFGRKPVLQADVAIYSILALASAFSPNLWVLLALRFGFGFAMGGEWGIGASLALETIPVKSRGIVSGILQEGYPVGFFLASLANLALPHIGWRAMLVLGVIPALLILFIRRHVPESPAWIAEHKAGKTGGKSFVAAMKGRWGLLLYAVVLMTCFNFFSHGSQDIYPTFLKVQHKFDAGTVTILTMVLNVGAVLGGLIFGTLSERIGRRKAIVLAALLALPIIPLWAFSATPLLLGLGAFLIQIAVQGAWGVVPVHLNELSPPEARGAFPGFAYQLGNLIAAGNATLQAGIAKSQGDNYGLALGVTIAVVAVVLSVVTWFGPEAKGVDFAQKSGAKREGA